jgi:hypothetical protein
MGLIDGDDGSISQEKFERLRYVEVKHGRIAMARAGDSSTSLARCSPH